MTKMRKKLFKKNFTLLEILAAATLFAILFSALLMPFHSTMSLRRNSRESENNIAPIRLALDLVARDFDFFAPNIHGIAICFGSQENIGNNRTDRIQFSSTSGFLTAQPNELPAPGSVLIELEVREDEQSGELQWWRKLTTNQMRLDGEHCSELLILAPVLEIQWNYFDGSTWLNEWTDINTSVPYAVELTLLTPGINEENPQSWKLFLPLKQVQSEEETNE